MLRTNFVDIVNKEHKYDIMIKNRITIKQYVFTALLTIFTASPIISSVSSPRFEGLLGLNYSKLNISSKYPMIEENYVIGLSGGGNTIYTLSPISEISVGLFLTERKSSVTTTITESELTDFEIIYVGESDLTFTFTNLYLDIPIT
jgi:hypothetical protein